MEAQISSIVRNTFTQMNFSASTKYLKDYVKNVDVFHHNPLIGETFATCMADLLTLLELSCCLGKLAEATTTYLLPMDPADLTYGKIIIKEPDVKKSLCRSESVAGALTGSV
ncbi:hypothetical protein ACTXT7_001434 [Hymenolepis weldensis]